MNTDNTDTNQTEPLTRQTGELPNLTIAEKVCSTQFETNLYDYRIFEPDLMAAMIRDIIGDNATFPWARTIIKPSDELAHFFINLRDEAQFNEIGQRGLDEAIELCFLHSAAYQAALEIYRLEHEGHLVGGGTAHETFQEIVDKAGAGPGSTKPSDTTKQQTAPDIDSPTESKELSSNEIFVRSLTEITTDPNTPQEASYKLAAIISQLRKEDKQPQSTGEIKPQRVGDLIASLLEDKNAPEIARDAISEAAERIMNDLNTGDEMTIAWFKLFYDKAIGNE